MAAKRIKKQAANGARRGGDATGSGGSKKPSTAKGEPRGAQAAGVELDKLRVLIDGVDRKLVKLLHERARLVQRVGATKRGAGLPIYTPHREQEVLGKVIGWTREMGGPLPEGTVEAIYRELMSGSFRLEQPLRIGYLGPVGSYSHVAAVKQFGSSVAFEDLHAIEGVFTEVARGHVDYGLVPIENTLGGGIVETLDAFMRYHADVHVYAEVQLGVHHALLANCAPGDVTDIHSKPEVFQQCRKWLATQYPRAELVASASSARAVITARDAAGRVGADAGDGAAKGGRGGVAAIGSVLAGELHGVHVLFEDIEDDPNNVTRFFVISKQRARPSGDDKTSLMFVTEDKPGALAEVLTIFHRAGVNLAHIDKRPSGRVNWTYTFFVDAVGHEEDADFRGALRQVEGACKEVHVLGSYPRSKRIL